MSNMSTYVHRVEIDRESHRHQVMPAALSVPRPERSALAVA